MTNDQENEHEKKENKQQACKGVFARHSTIAERKKQP